MSGLCLTPIGSPKPFYLRTSMRTTRGQGRDSVDSLRGLGWSNVSGPSLEILRMFSNRDRLLGI